MSAAVDDVVNRLAGIAPGAPLAHLRVARPVTTAAIEASHQALFEPADPAGVSRTERYAIAVFLARLHEDAKATAFYAAGLSTAEPQGEIGRAVDAAAAAKGTQGFTLDGAERTILGSQIAAALEHAYRLVFHPRDSGPDALRHLLAAGWLTTDIVTLLQLVAFSAFQLRVVGGLRILQAGAR